eukprot:661456_1
MAISFANFSYAVMLMYLALTFAALSNHVSAGNGTVKLVYPKTNKWNNIGTVMTTLALSGPNAALTVGQLKRQIGTEINIVPGCLQFAFSGNMMTDSGVLNSYPRDGDDVLPILVVFRRDAPGCSRYFETFDNLAPEFEDPLQSGKVLYNADRSIKHGRKEIVVTAQESNQWTCPKCTFKNAKIMTRCETCLTPKLNPVAPKSNHMAPKFESTAPKSKRTAPKSKRTAPKSKRMAPKFEITAQKSKRAAPKSKDWKCPKCTWVNAERLHTCYVCDTKKPEDGKGGHVHSNDNNAQDKPVQIAPRKDGQGALIDSNGNKVQSKPVQIAPREDGQGVLIDSNDKKVQNNPVQTAPLKDDQGAHVHSNDNKAQDKPIQTAPLKDLSILEQLRVMNIPLTIRQVAVQQPDVKYMYQALDWINDNYPDALAGGMAKDKLAPVDQALPDYWNDGPVRVDPLQDKNPSFINLKTGLIVCILVVLAIWIYRIKFHSK